MNDITIKRYEFDSIMESIQKALDVCERVDYSDDAKCENTPPYIVGWSKSTLRNLVTDLNRILEYSNNV
jgi:hypothetical protein